MFTPFAGLWKYVAGGAGLVAAAAIGAALWIDADRDRLRGAIDVLAGQAETIVGAVRQASGNEQVSWKTAPGQIYALGDSNRALKGSIETQNRAIDEMAREAVRLKARAAELKAIADKAEAQRRDALERLSDMAATPGTRSDALQLLREAEAALDIVYESEGL